jgi:hypothetical protein
VAKKVQLRTACVTPDGVWRGPGSVVEIPDDHFHPDVHIDLDAPAGNARTEPFPESELTPFEPPEPPASEPEPPEEPEEQP